MPTHCDCPAPRPVSKARSLTSPPLGTVYLATTLSTTEERAALAAFEAQNTKIVNKLMHCLNSSTRQWARHEWFYSSLDRDYFNNNEFQTMLDMSNLDHVEKVTE
jgi:hypothetical protein